MALSIRIALFLRPAALTLALLLAVASPAYAQGSGTNVQTYVDQAVPAGMPDGVQMGRPLKAGDLYLQKKTEPKPQAAPIAPRYPIGQLQPPKMSKAAPVTPPQLSSSDNSSASFMLMQGMKSALQQVGQNPEIPPSDIEASEPKLDAKRDVPNSEVVPTSRAPNTDGVKYEEGQAPRNLEDSLPPDVTAKPATAMPAAEPAENKTEIAAPKATDLTEAPASLADRAASDESIFGAPVKSSTAQDKEESAEVAPTPTASETKAEIADLDVPPSQETKAEEPIEPKAETVAVSSVACEAKVTEWTKECQDVGYPDDFVGKVTGETRFECPGNVLQDVWLTNSCAPGTPGNAAKKIVAAEPAKNSDSKAKDQKTDKSDAAADLKRVDAKCGRANDKAAEQAPSDQLCDKGIASRVNGEGPWYWACSGMNGGAAVSCSAKQRIDGNCGAAAGSSHDLAPKGQLCASGTASAISGEGPWSWNCGGVGGGKAATCTAQKKQPAICGPAALVGQRGAPREGLCNAGEAGTVEGSGPWSWNCAGLNGGASVACTAAVLQDGACGSANGQGLTEAPTDELCASGEPSKVTGKGPWQWSCSGSQGGKPSACIAPKAQAHSPVVETASPVEVAAAAPVAAPDAACGGASAIISETVPTTDLCAAGYGSSAWLNAKTGLWNWECNSGGDAAPVVCTAATPKTAKPVAVATPLMAAAPDKNASTAVPAKPEPVAPAPEPKVVVEDTAQCGAATGIAVGVVPSADLCIVGRASAVKAQHMDWVWSCAKGKKDSVTCVAPMIVDGNCGASSGIATSSRPIANLCASGTATQVAGNGPWQWSCLGENGGTNVSCSASVPAKPRIDGACGIATELQTDNPPQQDLCISGTASTVFGESPFTWTCSGQNGGVAVSCATLTPAEAPPPGPPVDGLCGATNGVPAINRPRSDLCASGTPTQVTGNGPWNWSCFGLNSGMTVSCTAPLMPPPPVNGECGSANGMPAMTQPRSGLCDGGIASSVNGNGPWTWSCSGVNGGSAVSCVAPSASRSGSMPSLVRPGQMGDRSDIMPAPDAAPAGLVTPRLGLSAPEAPIPNRSSRRIADVPPTPPAESLGTLEIPPPPPQLPEEVQPIPAPPLRDASSPPPALKPPVIDSSGEVVTSQRLQLESALSSIGFDLGSDTLDKDAVDKLNRIASVLLANGYVRMTATAYADNRGMSTREARRLSLARALAIRDYLVTKGVASGRIDVRALGANVPSGDADRVDLKIN